MTYVLTIDFLITVSLWMFILYCFCVFFSRRRQHTRCALVTGVQTCALPICDDRVWLHGTPWGIAGVGPDRRRIGYRQAARKDTRRCGRFLVQSVWTASSFSVLTAPRMCLSDSLRSRVAAASGSGVSAMRSRISAGMCARPWIPSVYLCSAVPLRPPLPKCRSRSTMPDPMDGARDCSQWPFRDFNSAWRNTWQWAAPREPETCRSVRLPSDPRLGRLPMLHSSLFRRWMTIWRGSSMQRVPPTKAGPPHTICRSCCVVAVRSEEHTSELQSLMRISYAVF